MQINDNNKNIQNIQNSDFQKKLERMRAILTDEQRCKEIAQKLSAYISGT